jgi:hypothetical protein
VSRRVATNAVLPGDLWAAIEALLPTEPSTTHDPRRPAPRAAPQPCRNWVDPLQNPQLDFDARGPAGAAVNPLSTVFSTAKQPERNTWDAGYVRVSTEMQVEPDALAEIEGTPPGD